MKVYEVVGYTADASTWCPRCLPYDPEGRDSEGNPVGAVLAGSEWDYRPACEGCGEQLEVIVIGG